jgi:ribosomal protein S6
MAKKDIELVEETNEEGADQVRVYELAFHLDPELSETEAKKAYGALKEAAAEKGTVLYEGAPEKIQLAYTISRQEQAGRRDFDAAWFAWIAYEATGAAHDEVAEAVRAEKRIVRFLDIRTDREAAKHAAELQELREKAPDAPGERVSDAELDAAIQAAA